MNQLMAKAKAALILDQPFFASILLGMEIVEDSTIPTLATNGEEIRYNPEFLNSLTLAELIFVLGHEVLHTVFQHMTRRESRDPMGWNIAADYVINDLLVKERVGSMPKVGLHDPALVAKGHGTTEGVYSVLNQQKQNQPKPGKSQKQKPGQPGQPGQPDDSGFPSPGEPGGALDQVNDAGSDPASLKQKEAEIRVKIVQAKNAAKAMGRLSAGLARVIDDLTKPRVDWREVLRNFLTTKAKTELSYSKPKRRFLADDLILPSLTGQRLGKIAVAVDCSGSINDSLLAEFKAEILAIVEDTRPESVEVIYFDSEVCGRESFGPDDAIDLKPMGGGGTAFSPIFKALVDSEIVACIVLTDLESNDFGDPPEFPVLWASTENNRAPFGDVTLIKGVL